MLGSLVQVVNDMLNLHDPTAAGHQSDVALLAGAIAEEMRHYRDVVDCVFLAGQIHDIGKIAIPSEILALPGKLDHIQQELEEHKGILYDSEVVDCYKRMITRKVDRLTPRGKSWPHS